MGEFDTDWTKEDLLAYILLYAAKADFVETQEEKDLIIAKVHKEEYDKIHKEIDNDNDYVSAQKIYTTLHSHNYTHEDTDSILSEIKKLFLADGNFDILERNMLIALKRLFTV